MFIQRCTPFLMFLLVAVLVTTAPFAHAAPRIAGDQPTRSVSSKNKKVRTPTRKAGGYRAIIDGVLARQASTPTGTSAAAIGFNLGVMPSSIMSCEGVVNLVQGATVQESKAWISQGASPVPWSTNRPFLAEYVDAPPLTEPDQYAALVLCGGARGVIRPGKFIVTWTGTGDVQVMWAARNVRRLGSNRIEFDVLPDADNGAILLRVANPALATRIQNMRVVRAENEFVTTFWTEKFVRLLHGIGGQTLRVLNLSGANFPRSDVRPYRSLRWSERVPATGVLQGDERLGMAIEHIAELALRTKADLYYTLPHTVDDEFVENLVSLLDRTLSQEQTIYLEFSNEVWNEAFGQTHAARQDGLARELSVDPYVAQRRSYACRFVEVAQVAQRTLQLAQSPRRLKTVFGFQNANLATLTDSFEYRCPNGLRARDVATTVASAPYFGNDGMFVSPASAQLMVSLGVNAMVDRLAAEADRVAAQFLTSVVPLAQQYQKELITYEGGSHLAWFPDLPSNLERPLTKLFAKVNEHPRMYDIMKRYVRAILTGASSYNHYRFEGAHNNFSTFGLFQNDYEIESEGDRPRLRALRDLLIESRSSETPRLAQLAPSVIDGTRTEYLVLQGTGLGDATVELEGIPMATRVVSAGVVVAEVPAGIAEGNYRVTVRDQISRISESLTLAVRPPAVQPVAVVLTSVNAGSDEWNTLGVGYGATLALYGDGFTSLAELLIDGRVVPRSYYVVVAKNMILLRVFSELPERSHSVAIRDRGMTTQSMSFRVVR